LIQGAHVGIHRQKQDGMYYVGLVGPAGRLTADQLRAVADIAAELASSELRLTVWQNILIPNVPERNIAIVKHRLEEAGLTASPSSIRAGVVACTGSAGCKFAATNTKRDALRIADHVESKLPILNQPLNVHLTGCPHSCAQHYIGDIGLLGTKVGDDAVEGYHIYVGGGYGTKQDIGREVMRNVLVEDVPGAIEKIIGSYLEQRRDEQESFVDFLQRQPDERLREVLATTEAEVMA
jgi:ferredoxin-nitrite reductase